MNRLVVALVWFAAVIAGGACVAGESKRPNVLLITADDLGLQLSCYGDTAIRTPRLDALAERGTLFTRAYVTQASCSPSRSSMFTGLYPHANGHIGLEGFSPQFKLHEGLAGQTLPALLKREGYRTGIIGKLHVAPKEYFPFDFNLNFDSRDVQRVADEASRFIKDGDAPFFLMVNYIDPHVVLHKGRAFADQFNGVPEKPLVRGAAPPLPFQAVDCKQQLERISGYYNAIMRLDAGVGLLLDVLESSGVRDETLVIFLSDNGPPFDRAKTSCYEGGLHVPFIVDWPGVSKPMRSDALISSVDILPTILDAVGAPTPEGLHGKSLRPVVSDPSATLRDTIAGEFHYHVTTPFFPRRTLRDERYKLIHNLLAGKAKAKPQVDGDAGYACSQAPELEGTKVRAAFDRLVDPPEFELYDLENDPWEFDDLSASSDHAEHLERLKQKLTQWQRETNDPLLTEEGLQRMQTYEIRP